MKLSDHILYLISECLGQVSEAMAEYFVPYCPVVFPKIYEMLSNYIKTLQVHFLPAHGFQRELEFRLPLAILFALR